MDFGDKLKQYRLKEGLSQEQLAEKIGVSRQAITKWETKRGLPDVENMIILAELFKLTLDELVLEEVKKQVTDMAEELEALSVKETELEILEYVEAAQNQGRSMNITEDLRKEINQLRANIQAADEGRFEDIKTKSMLKSDPVEWTKEYEDVIDAADHEAYQHLGDAPRGMGFCFAYWAEKRNALARRGIEWRSPSRMNPGVMFD